MFGICIESSHKKGMGHLFRMLNLIEYLKKRNRQYIAMINSNKKAINILENNKIDFEVVDIEDNNSNWETKNIKKYNIDIWINDRLDTSIEHAKNVKGTNIKLITFDDRGQGARLSDINFGSLPASFGEELRGDKVFKGIKYLILNKEIDKYKKIRNESGENIIISLGGSDTYGVTVEVVNILKKLGKKATVIVGPSFKHEKELKEVIDGSFILKKKVPSLIEEFSYYDLAITGGGVTPFEANASGLPCLIIANEIHEIHNGKFLDELGSSRFIGYREDISINDFEINIKDLETMSRTGIENMNTKGIERIYDIMKD